MDPGGDSGAKVVSEGLRRCSGNALWTDFAPFWSPFWTPKSIIFDINFVMNFVMCFLSPLEAFGVDFGAIVVSKSVKNAKYRYMRNRCFM